MSYKKNWQGKFGRQYTERNMVSIDETDEFYFRNFSISRTKLNKEFLNGRIKKKSKILEIGCNIGNQLLLLQKTGYFDLWAIELQDFAVEIAKKRVKGINIIRASADDIPFKDNYFDLVYTSGLLIHISPKNIGKVLDEIYRCTNSYIWGFEYYRENEYQMVNYRGKENLLWKTNFPKLFLERFVSLKLIQKRILKYRDNDNLDIMYLLKKS